MLRFALTLADELHFGRAARRHYIAEPAFGRYIKRLERSLGTPLFERTSRRVTLTPAGARLIAEARDLVASFDRLALAGPVADSRTIRLGVLGFGLAGWWAPFHDAVTRALPELQIEFVDLDFATEHSLLRTGQIDVALLQDVGPVGGIVLSPVGSIPHVLVAPRESRIGRRGRVSSSDLGRERWLEVVGRSSRVPGALENSRGAWASLVRTPAAIPSAVATTGRVCLHAEAAREYFPHPDVTYIPFDGPPAVVGVATRSDETRPDVLAFRDAASRVASAARPSWRVA